LLSAAGAGSADPQIRSTLVAEAGPGERRYGLDSFLGNPIVQDPAREATRLDSREEAERLRAQGLTTPTPPPEPIEE
jgi:hypothetical protein